MRKILVGASLVFVVAGIGALLHLEFANNGWMGLAFIAMGVVSAYRARTNTADWLENDRLEISSDGIVQILKGQRVALSYDQIIAWRAPRQHEESSGSFDDIPTALVLITKTGELELGAYFKATRPVYQWLKKTIPPVTKEQDQVSASQLRSATRMLYFAAVQLLGGSLLAPLILDTDVGYRFLISAAIFMTVMMFVFFEVAVLNCSVCTKGFIGGWRLVTIFGPPKRCARCDVKISD